MKSLSFYLLPLSVLVSLACMPKPVRQVRAFWASDFVAYDLHRVAVFPFIEDMRTDQSEVSRSLTGAFVQSLRKKSPYEVIEIDRDVISEVQIGNPGRKGEYSTNTLIAIGKRFRADAIVFGSVTALRSYYPQSLGLNVEMVSIETGATLWSVDALYDAADADVENAVKQYYELESARYSGTEDWTILMNSPVRFAGFVASRCVDALWKPEPKPRKQNAMVERLGY